MFLVAFVTLILLVIGLFTQIVSTQSAQIYNAQTTLANTMTVWHGVAVNEVMNSPPTNISTAGCSMVQTAGTGTAGTGTTGTGTTGTGTTGTGTTGRRTAGRRTTGRRTTGTGTAGTGTAGTGATSMCSAGGHYLLVDSNTLPPGYNMQNYSFYSIAYEAATGTPGSYADFVITYLPYTHTSTGQNLLILNGSVSSFTLSDLITQLKNQGYPTLLYGTVNTSGTLTTATGGLSITVPSSIPVGSVAIVSAAS